MRTLHFLLLLGLAASPALAQNSNQIAPHRTPINPNALPNKEQEPAHRNQRVQHILVEDEGARVDELRIGGQTKRITVHPKTGEMPNYEVRSNDGSRGRTGSLSGADARPSPRVWNVLQF